MKLKDLDFEDVAAFIMLVIAFVLAVITERY